ncbi:hypothetical protein ACN3XK_60500 [Actinomadura welshii]
MRSMKRLMVVSPVVFAGSTGAGSADGTTLLVLVLTVVAVVLALVFTPGGREGTGAGPR